MLLEDWIVIGFYQSVEDQVENLTPMGMKGGGVIVVPRLEAWRAALEIHDFPRCDWLDIVDAAKFIFECAQGRIQFNWSNLSYPEDYYG